MKYALMYVHDIVFDYTMALKPVKVIKELVDSYELNFHGYYDNSRIYNIVSESGEIVCTFNLENRWIFDLWMNSLETA